MKEAKLWETRSQDQAHREAARRKELEIQMKTATLGSQGVRGLTDIIVLTIKHPEYVKDISTRYRRTAALTDLGIPVNLIGDPVLPLDDAQRLAVNQQIKSFNEYLQKTADTRMTVIGASGGVRLSERVIKFVNT